MHDLSPITALGGQEARTDRVAGVTLSEVPDLALASVAARLGQETACTAQMTALLGVGAPGPGKACLRDPEGAVWTGPDQWLVTAPFATHEDIAARMSAHFGSVASVTEQTDAWAAFDLRGTGVETVMELLCNVNIRAMQSGDAARSSIHHLGCFVIRNDPPDWLRIIGPRSSAGSLHHAIHSAMKAAL